MNISANQLLAHIRVLKKLQLLPEDWPTVNYTLTIGDHFFHIEKDTITKVNRAEYNRMWKAPDLATTNIIYKFMYWSEYTNLFDKYMFEVILNKHKVDQIYSENGNVVIIKDGRKGTILDSLYGYMNDDIVIHNNHIDHTKNVIRKVIGE